MNKTLIIVAHPNLNTSTVNRYWLEQLQTYEDKLTIHNLYAHYPNGNIDVAFEQKLLEESSHVVLQFPIYWFNCPPLLKKWLDDVLTYGWAYGNHSYKLKNKKIGLAVSAGIRESDYAKTGKYGVTLAELLKPFELTMNYIQADYQSIFAVYGANNEPEAGYAMTKDELINSGKKYIEWLMKSGMLSA